MKRQDCKTTSLRNQDFHRPDIKKRLRDMGYMVKGRCACLIKKIACTDFPFCTGKAPECLLVIYIRIILDTEDAP